MVVTVTSAAADRKVVVAASGSEAELVASLVVTTLLVGIATMLVDGQWCNGAEVVVITAIVLDMVASS